MGLDFIYNLEQKDRIYTIDHIKDIVHLYNKAIKYHLNISNNHLRAFVFERDLPYKDRGNTLDGIHLMYPEIICDWGDSPHSPPFFGIPFF